MIVDSRQVTDAAGIPVFPEGFAYNFYEQYVNVRKHLMMDMGYVAGVHMEMITFNLFFSSAAVRAQF